MISTVKIGHLDYDIKQVPHGSMENNAVGQIDQFRTTIKLDEDLGNDLVKETLLHEIIHGIDFMFGINLREKQVEQLGVGLATVFRDNPHLIKYFTSNCG